MEFFFSDDKIKNATFQPLERGLVNIVCNIPFFYRLKIKMLFFDNFEIIKICLQQYFTAYSKILKIYWIFFYDSGSARILKKLVRTKILITMQKFDSKI